MFTLIGLGVSVSYVYSIIAALAPAAFPPSFRDAMGQVPVYFEAAAMGASAPPAKDEGFPYVCAPMRPKSGLT